MGDTGLVGCVALVICHALDVENAAEAAELAVIADSKDDVAVVDRDYLVGRYVRVGIAEFHGRDAGNQVVHVLVGENRGHDVEQGHVDLLAFACFHRMDQRALNGGDGIDAGKNVGDCDAGLHRLTIRFTGNRHEAGHALNDVIVAGEAGIGAVLTEAGDRAIDELRIDLLQALIVEAVFLQSAELEVFDQDV
ncbi:hypothetical protein D3C73_631210 [compost metagenome]